MWNWKKLTLLAVIGVAIAGITAGSFDWYYAPYRNTHAFFPNAESGSGFHLTDCDGYPHGGVDFKCCTVNHVLYYEYTFVVNCGWEETGDNLSVSLSQDGGALTLKFGFNYTGSTFCFCKYKLNGYVAGLSRGHYDLTVVKCEKTPHWAENITVGTVQVTI